MSSAIWFFMFWIYGDERRVCAMFRGENNMVMNKVEPFIAIPTPIYYQSGFIAFLKCSGEFSKRI
jgi:hypothetical protein